MKDSLKEVIAESSELFSILNVPPRRKEKHISRVFTISDISEYRPPSKDHTVEEVQVRIK